MDSNNSFSGLRVALLLVGGSLEVEGAVTSLALSVFIVLVEENLGDEGELEGDLISGGSVGVKAAASVPSKIVSMQ